MIDVTSTSFGLIIAYLLPGLTALYSLRFFSAEVDKAFATLLTAQSNFSLFFMLVFAGLTLGLIITVFRWIVFDCFFCKELKLNKSDFAALGEDEKKLMAFRASIDEHYRYHQFWGGSVFAILFLFIGVMRKYMHTLETSQIYISIVLAIGLELILCVAAVEAYKYYICRAQFILGGRECQMDGEKPN